MSDLEQSVNVWEGMGSTCNQKQSPESVDVHIISSSLDELQHYHIDLRNTYIFALFAVKCNTITSVHFEYQQ